jgi:hypothetical protein
MNGDDPDPDFTEEDDDPIHGSLKRIDRHLREGLAAIAAAIVQAIAPAEQGLSIGRPAITDQEGNVMTVQINSNNFGFFPLKVGGAPPLAGDVFTPTPAPGSVFTCAMDVMPSGPDEGLPAVKVTATTLAGAPGQSFTVKDSNGDTAASETFDIIPPTQPPMAISIDEPNIVTTPNPSPPTV